MSSRSLLESFARSAMLGLLAAASSGCSEPAVDDSADDAQSGGAPTSGGSSGAGGTDPGGGGAASGGAIAAGGVDSSGGTAMADGGAPSMGILSSQVVPDLSLEQFTSDCQKVGGVVETHAVCGGQNTCKGFSYDDDTDVLTDHTCRGYNTCSGFSCVVSD